jgi:hypothetical protein
MLLQENEAETGKAARNDWELSGKRASCIPHLETPILLVFRSLTTFESGIVSGVRSQQRYEGAIKDMAVLRNVVETLGTKLSE